MAPWLDLGVKRIISSVRRRFRAGERDRAIPVTNLWAMPSRSLRLSQFDAREANQDAGTAHVVVDKVINVRVRSVRILETYPND